jgi:DNA invertase Pin-like site-specific DNA recombinase
VGLEAQRTAIESFAAAEGFEIVTEVETGKDSDALERRPQLSAAREFADERKRWGVAAALNRA